MENSEKTLGKVNLMALGTILTSVLAPIAGNLIRRAAGAVTSSGASRAARGAANLVAPGPALIPQIQPIPTGMSGAEVVVAAAGTDTFKIDALGQLVLVKKRRRRKRLLTCSDKADIAFVTGTLGKGSLAQSAISSLLARCG